MHCSSTCSFISLFAILIFTTPSISLSLPPSPRLALPITLSANHSLDWEWPPAYHVPNTDVTLRLDDIEPFYSLPESPTRHILTSTSSKVDNIIDRRGETALNHLGYIAVDFHEGVQLTIQALNQHRGELDWGTIGDVVEGLVKWQIEGRRFKRLKMFFIETGMGETKTQLGHGCLAEDCPLIWF